MLYYDELFILGPEVEGGTENKLLYTTRAGFLRDTGGGTEDEKQKDRSQL